MNWKSNYNIQALTCNEDLLIVYGTKEMSQSFDLQYILIHEELKYAERLHNENQKHTWLVCRTTLRLILAKKLSIPPQSIVFQKGDYGKLYVAESNVFFNISHTNDAFILAFSTLGQVGIDIEKLIGNEDLPSLVRYAFSEDEIAYCQNGILTNRFSEVWTLKEAFLKAVGVGLVDDLTSMPVIGEKENMLNLLNLNHKTFLCPDGETASIVYNGNQKLELINLIIRHYID